MRRSRVRYRWAERQPVLCVASALKDATAAELISLMGFDCIWLDLEHNPIGITEAAEMMRGARVGGADVLARPGKGEFMLMGRLLEAGASGILYPRCESADEAAEVVRWARFAPTGERGFAGGNADNDYGLNHTAPDYVRRANEDVFLAVQIETPSSLSQAGAMARVEGVDMVFFGPGDFSVFNESPGAFGNEAVQAALRQTCEATLAAGKHFGTLVPDPAYIPRVLEMGASFIAHGSDMGMIRKGFAHLKANLSEHGFPFGSPEAEASTVI